MFQEHTSFLYVQTSVANLGSVVKIIIISYFNRMTISVIKTAINMGSV